MHSFNGISSAFDQLVLILKKFIVQYFYLFCLLWWVLASPIFFKGLDLFVYYQLLFVFLDWFAQSLHLLIESVTRNSFHSTPETHNAVLRLPDMCFTFHKLHQALQLAVRK